MYVVEIVVERRHWLVLEVKVGREPSTVGSGRRAA